MSPVETMSRDELVAEVTRLRDELDSVRIERADAVLRREFRLAPVELKYLNALRKANGTPLSTWTFSELGLAPNGYDRGSNVVGVYLSRLRKALGKDTIDNNWGRGWTLNAKGQAIVSEALEKAGALG